MAYVEKNSFMQVKYWEVCDDMLYGVGASYGNVYFHRTGKFYIKSLLRLNELDHILVREVSEKYVLLRGYELLDISLIENEKTLDKCKKV